MFITPFIHHLQIISVISKDHSLFRLNTQIILDPSYSAPLGYAFFHDTDIIAAPGHFMGLLPFGYKILPKPILDRIFDLDGILDTRKWKVLEAVYRLAMKEKLVGHKILYMAVERAEISGISGTVHALGFRTQSPGIINKPN